MRKIAWITFMAIAGAGPGLAGVQQTLLEADQSDARFGRQMTPLGDVNGDGWADFAIGASRYDDGEVDEGAVFVYLGLPSGFPATADQVLQPDLAGADFGAWLAGGDVNDDGFGDLAVGAPQYDDGTDVGGRVYLYFGSASGLPTAPSQTLSQAQAGAAFGRTVAIVGDVNDDGFDDLAVGAPRTDGDATDEGAAYLYFGGSSGVSASPDWARNGSGFETQYGLVVASVGDVDGDGVDDFAVTSRFGGVNVRDGHAEVFHGSAAAVSTSPASILDLDTREARTGWDIGGGDFDDDGYSDVALGSRLYDTIDNPGGVVAIFPGSSSGLGAVPAPALLLNSGVDDARFGISLAAGEDVNNDGYGDLAVGARKFPVGGQAEGAAFVFLGGSTGLSELPEFAFTYGQPDADAGRPVEFLGDLDGDGTSDLGVGAFFYDNGQTDEGVVFVHTGFADFVFADGFEGPSD